MAIVATSINEHKDSSTSLQLCRQKFTRSCRTDVVRGAVGAVDGGIGAAGHCMGIEDLSLVKDIQANGGFRREVLFREMQ